MKLKTILAPYWLLLLGCLLFVVTSKAGTSTYDDFSSPDGLILQGYAAPFEGRLRLTPAIGGRGIGGAWLEAKQSVKGGFETMFQIQITDKYVYGADGLAFVIQNSLAPGLGWAGGNIGFGGLTNLLVVKFDNYHWRNGEFCAFDEIAVLTGKSATAILLDNVSNTVASATSGVVFSDGQMHTVRIVYVPGNLQVYLDDLENPQMTVYINLAKVLDLDDGRAWVGFTAAGGADWQNQDLISWSFTTDDLTRTDRSKTQSDSQNTIAVATSTPIFSVSKPDASGATPLISDRAFGYTVPKDIAPGLQIEASSDLVHWSSLTNTAVYFRDPDSTNYTTRFYRFPRN